MSRRLITLMLLAVSVMFVGQACATKKYVRKTIEERVAPLEGRTAELEQSVARNTSAIKEVDERLSRRIDTVNEKADAAQRAAEEADRKAREADQKAVAVKTDLNDTKGKIDDFVVTKSVSVYFKTNRWELSPEAKAELDALASAAKSRKGTRIQIEGYADRRGGIQHNIVLTNNRAETVIRYILNTHKIELWRMQYLGAGKIDDGARSKDELQQNRRVDVRLLENAVVKNSGSAG